LVEKDRTARSVWAVNGERIVSHEDEHFADLGIAKALSTRVAGLAVSDETLPAGGPKSVSCSAVDRGKSIVCVHIDNGRDRRRPCPAAFGRNATQRCGLRQDRLVFFIDPVSLAIAARACALLGAVRVPILSNW
jgi:hypothetical protein